MFYSKAILVFSVLDQDLVSLICGRNICDSEYISVYDWLAQDYDVVGLAISELGMPCRSVSFILVFDELSKKMSETSFVLIFIFKDLYSISQVYCCIDVVGP